MMAGPSATTFHSLRDERFRRLFDDFQSTAYRLETRQSYDVSYEQEEFERFRAGRARGQFPGIASWADRVRAGRRLGKSFTRVHVMEEPLTDYLRFEAAWCYRDTVAAGEDVRVIPIQPGQWPDGIPRLDYWLFDSHRLLLMNYSRHGTFLSAELVNDPERVSDAVRWQQRAWALSVPFNEYAAGFDEFMRRR
ncbi:DUF6879 family protein [Actinomadura miaoliensis]|uniref:DUF6879 domain-containing protein n=1 Tax=Actinomadura miaoliensis TaxID=430685 RepID=A0ABP7W7W6_9ACTN